MIIKIIVKKPVKKNSFLSREKKIAYFFLMNNYFKFIYNIIYFFLFI